MVVRDGMRALVAVDTGELKRNIAVKSYLDDDRRQVGAIIGPKYPVAKRANLLEYGSATQRPQPFIRPGGDTTKTAQKRALEQHLRTRWETI